MFKQIPAAAARQLIRERSPVILDVRDVNAYSDVRIPNAIHVTLATIQATVKQIARETPLLIYCYRGLASQDFAELFSDLGFREVYSLEGGFHAWHASAGEIERPLPRTPEVRSSPLIDWLLDMGGDPDRPGAALRDGTPALIKACQEGRQEVVEAMIEAGVDLTVLDAYGNDALWGACYSGNLRTIGALLNAGIDLDRRNRVGATALIYAASAGKTEVVEFLLEAGADPSLSTEDGFSALDLAANPETLKLLRKPHRRIA